MMNVADLIRALAGHPPNTRVRVIAGRVGSPVPDPQHANVGNVRYDGDDDVLYLLVWADDDPTWDDGG